MDGGDRFFYWTGKEIIPKHAAFTGMTWPLSGSSITFIPIYPEKSWVTFTMTIIFHNLQETANCKLLGNSYDIDCFGKCRKKCKTDDGVYLLDQQNRCVRNSRMRGIIAHPSGLLQSAIHPDIKIVKLRDSPPYMVNPYGMEFIMENWPYEPLPFLMRQGLAEEFKDFSKEKLEELKFERHGFKMGSRFSTCRDVFNFPNGTVKYFSGRVPLHEAPVFLRALRNYLSEIFIKEG